MIHIRSSVNTLLEFLLAEFIQGIHRGVHLMAEFFDCFSHLHEEFLAFFYAVYLATCFASS